MELNIISSGSAGNSYLLRAESGAMLLIECGVSFKDIMQAINFDVTNIACIVSHLHSDHSKSIEKVVNHAIPVYSNKSTLEHFDILNHHKANVIKPGKKYKIIESFTVMPFHVEHDVETYGFLIYHPECGLVLFLTDTSCCPYKFHGLNNIIIECNYSLEKMQDNIIQGNINTYLANRVTQTHMSLRTCTGILTNQDLSEVAKIVLIHLSANNGEPERFKSVIKAATGKEVFIARANKKITFNKKSI